MAESRSRCIARRPLVTCLQRIIGCNPAEAITAIAWIKEFSSLEVHTDELEKFLLVKGICAITISEKVHWLGSRKYGEHSFIYQPSCKSYFPAK